MKKRLITALCALALVLLASCSSVLPFEGSALPDGKVGVEYETSIATGTKDMYYDLDYDSSLPGGLILYDDGVIKGIPSESGSFTFKAVMIDLEDNEYYADFSFQIEGGELVYSGSALPGGKTGDPYRQELGTASGMEKITYALKEGSALPEGLTLTEDGTLSGIPAAAGDVSLTVVASASGCDDVEAVFTFAIEQGAAVDTSAGRIIFEDFTLPDGAVGDDYSESVRLAYGVPNITYSFRFSSGSGLPSGLKADKELGLISGTPTDSTTGPITFRVTAAAEGYESVTVNATLNVADKYLATTRFETEYVDTIPTLTGNGYSDSKSGRGMIQNTPQASNGHMLGYLNKPTDVTFIIYADSDTTAKLTLGLGSEVGNYTYDPAMFGIIVNGVEIDYGTLSVKQIGDSEANYQSGALAGPSISLNAGENTITFSIRASDKATGTFSAVGCLFDYIELTGASCELGWYPRVGNVQ